MRKNESVSKIMTSNLISVNKKACFSDVKKIFQKYPFHHVPVLEGEKLIGIISTDDMLKATFSEMFFQNEKEANVVLDCTLSIQEIMTKNPTSISIKLTIREAAILLRDCPFNALPVVDEKQNILGIVTSKDLIRYLLEQY
jgi:CBS domain-containing membrane protein